MNFLKDILQAVTAPVHGVENAAKALAGNHAGGGVGQAMQGIGKGVAQAAAPDLTYNPNPNTNIPNSTHDANFARALAGNPGLMKQMLLNVIAPHLSADSNAQVQGQQNPGNTSLQNSGQGDNGFYYNN